MVLAEEEEERVEDEALMGKEARREMGFVGEQFTWRRRTLWECLDRAVCNGAFLGLFPAAVVTNAAHTKSDHQPVGLDLEGCSRYGPASSIET